jgi:hypothetical protein
MYSKNQATFPKSFMMLPKKQITRARFTTSCHFYTSIGSPYVGQYVNHQIYQEW